MKMEKRRRLEIICRSPIHIEITFNIFELVFYPPYLNQSICFVQGSSNTIYVLS